MTSPRTLLAAAAMAALAMTGCGDTQPPAAAPAPPPTTFRVVGYLAIEGPGNFVWESRQNPVCAGTDGYDDIKPGAQVVVTDASGATVGIGTLEQGLASYSVVDGEARGTDCKFSFSVDIPPGKGFYGVEVTHRGRVQYTEAQLRETLQLTLS